jgi:hypothetical protein
MIDINRSFLETEVFMISLLKLSGKQECKDYLKTELLRRG